MLFKTRRALSFLDLCVYNSRKTRALAMVKKKYHMAGSKKLLYEDAVSVLNSLQTNAATLQQAKKRIGQQNTNVEDTRKYLERCGISQEMLDSNVSAIHIAGTKGKGSTCAFTESILRHSGFRTGFYSSPHLVAVRERIRIDGKPLSMEKFTHYFWEVYNSLLSKKESDCDMPPYFKFLTVMAFNVFIKEKVDVAVIEVGIGGEFDCTNVLRKPKAVGITSLGLDHTSLLGNTVELIAWQKAGIMKPSVPAFTVQNQLQDALQVLQQRANDIGCSLTVVPAFADYEWRNSMEPRLGLDSQVQSLNASLAIQLAHSWLSQSQNEKIKTDSVLTVPDNTITGLTEVSWPGRAQTLVYSPELKFFLDGAHTVESIENCVDWFLTASSRESSSDIVNRVLIFNSTGERDLTNLLQPLCRGENFSSVMFCPNIASTAQNQKADQSNFMVTTEQQLKRANAHLLAWKSIVSNNEVLKACNVSAFPCVTEALHFVKVLSLKEETHVLVTGSLHLVGCVLGQLEPDVEEAESAKESAKLN